MNMLFLYTAASDFIVYTYTVLPVNGGWGCTFGVVNVELFDVIFALYRHLLFTDFIFNGNQMHQ